MFKIDTKLTLKKVNLEFEYNDIQDVYTVIMYSGKRKDDNSTRVFKITFNRDSSKISEEIRINFTRSSLNHIVQPFNMNEDNLTMIVDSIMSETKEFMLEVENELKDAKKSFVKFDKTSIIICHPKVDLKSDI